MSHVSPPFIKLIPPILFPLASYIGMFCIYWNSSILIGLALLFLAGIMAFLFQDQLSNRMLFVAIAMWVAALLGIVRTHQLNQFYASFPFEHTQEPMSATGIVKDTSFQPGSRNKWCYTVLLKDSNDAPTYGSGHTVLIYSPWKMGPEVGDLARFDDISFKQSGDPSYRHYLMKSGISASGFARVTCATTLERPTFSFLRFWSNLRKRTFFSLKNKLNKQAFNLFATIFLGEKNSTKLEREKLEEPFRQWGIVHQLARSGLHLVIVISICLALLGVLPLPYSLKLLLLFIAVAVYSALSWTSISYLRALIVFLIYTLFQAARISQHFLHILSLSCFILLLVNPLYILFLDFQLSFGLTFCLAWLNLFRTIRISQKYLNT